MEWIAAGLVAGAWSWLSLPQGWLGAAALVLGTGAALSRRARRLLTGSLAGALLAAIATDARLDDTLAPELAGIDIRIEGRVEGLPERDGRRTRFRLLPTRGWVDGRAVELPSRIRLGWYGSERPAIAPGEQWRLTVRLRAPRGFANPGGFDYAGWLFREGIGATGYVRAGPAPMRLRPAALSIDGLRARLRALLQPTLARLEHGPILLALTLGDRSGIDNRRWQTLLATGTNHLMAISGLHVGLVAAMGYALGALAWRAAVPWRQRLARPMVQAITAMCLATAYAAMAGFALPTVRALAMLGLALGAVAVRRRVRPRSVLAGAAILVLLLDPLAVLAPGFWLSFGAVAAIVAIVAGRLGRPHRLAGWVRLQAGIALALAPLLLGLFRETSLVAPLANLIAVPWVSAISVPAALAGTALFPLLPAPAGLLLQLADGSLLLLWPVLDFLAGLPLAQWRTPALPGWLLLSAALAAVVLLLPRGVPGKPAALLALLALALWQPPRPPPGGFWVDVLDVGQGLAVVVRTARHVLVYDAGPRYSPGFDAGSAVVVPFLHAAGVGRVDALVVSHGDNDHAGGAPAVRERMRPRRVWSSVPRALGAEAAFCGHGVEWRWDGVRFRFLHPRRDEAWIGNDGSCVLRVDAEGGSLLLPGDIEAAAERRLLRGGAALEADVIVAPHHGSSTSSTPGFVAAVEPRWVLYSIGHANQWDLPRPEVVRRWQPAGAARTDCGGALHVEVDPRRGVSAPVPWRARGARPWQPACAASGKSGTIRAVRPPGRAAAAGAGRPGAGTRTGADTRPH